MPETMNAARICGRWASTCLAFAPLILGSGCGDAGGEFTSDGVSAETSGVQIRDSAGVEIVGNFGPAWGPGEALTVDPSDPVQIGAVDGEGPELFSSILWPEFLSDDRVAMVDGRAREIRIFGIDGSHLLTIGRAGDGPGEFQTTPMFAETPEGGFIAYDGMARRISHFGPDGTLTGEQPLIQAPATDTTPRLPLTQVSALMWDGTALAGTMAVQDIRAATTARVDTFATERFIVRDAGAGVTGLGNAILSQVGMKGRAAAPSPWPNPHPATATRPQPGFMTTGPGSWEIRRLGLHGELRGIVRIAVPRDPITPEVIAAEEALAIANGASRDIDPSDSEEAFRALTVPDSTPAIRAIIDTGDGGTWVERWRRYVDEDPAVFDVLDSDGRWLGSVEVAPELGTVADVRGDRILTVWRDEFDVPYLRIYGLREAGG